MAFMRGDSQAKAQGAYYSAGLRNYLVKVYNYMAMALGITGLVAFLVASSEVLVTAMYSSGPLMFIIAFAPIALVFFMNYKLHSLSFSATLAIFLAFSVLMGLSLSSIFIVYTSESIARVFFIAASMFGAVAYYGNYTKRDISQFGSFLIMGVIGLIIASVVNIFLGSSPLQFAISFVGVVVFCGLTAYDAQRIKDVYFQFSDGSEEGVGKLALSGATSLYLDFINIFVSLLRLMGDRR